MISVMFMILLAIIIILVIDFACVMICIGNQDESDEQLDKTEDEDKGTR